MQDHLAGYTPSELLAYKILNLIAIKRFQEACIRDLAEYFPYELPTVQSDKVSTETIPMPFESVSYVSDEILFFQCAIADPSGVPEATRGSVSAFYKLPLRR
jgi:hypothetical protein